MSTLVLNPTYVSLEILYEADLDSIRVPLQNFLNSTQLDGTNFIPNSLETSNLDQVTQELVVQTGMLLPFYGTTPPTGYVFCDGSTYATTAYPELYDVIVTTFGGTPGTNFQVPDMRGRTALTQDNLGGTAANKVTVFDATAIGNSGGNENLPAHTHGSTGLTLGDGPHTHPLSGGSHSHTSFKLANTGLNGGVYRLDSFTSLTGTTTSTSTGQTNAVVPTITYNTTGSDHSHAGDSSPVGVSGSTGTGPHQSVVQPSIICNWIIKT